MRLDDWFLTSEERGNPMTEIDSHQSGDVAWTEGNHVAFHIDGVSYFTSLAEVISRLEPHDEVRFTDWRGDADERVSGEGISIVALLANACQRGVDVRGLLWRSHSDRFAFSSKENRRLAVEVTEAGGEVLLDERVRRGGSHHQKMVLIRHPSFLDRDVAFIGGIDLSHGRRDDTDHQMCIRDSGTPARCMGEQPVIPYPLEVKRWLRRLANPVEEHDAVGPVGIESSTRLTRI